MSHVPFAFDADARRKQLLPKRSSWILLRESSLMMLVTAPIVYSLIVPLVFLDVFVTVYQAIVFPVYGMQRVRRSDFIILDRHMLPYLNTIQKINCVYCGYANGIACYVREIASRSEKNWCPIKHATKDENSHPRHREFCDYGDEKTFHKTIERT